MKIIKYIKINRGQGTSQMVLVGKRLPANTGDTRCGSERFTRIGSATHFSIFAWKIPCAEETGGPQSMGLQRVRHD